VRGFDHAEESFSCETPSMIHEALKILCRQCSEFACANMVQFHIGRIATDRAIVREQIVDFVGRESKSQGCIDVFQPPPARPPAPSRPRTASGRNSGTTLHLVERTEHRLGHAVVNELQDLMAVERGFAGKNPRRSRSMRRTASRPHRRAISVALEDQGEMVPKRGTLSSMRPRRRRGLAVLEQALQYIGFPRIERALGFDEMPVFGGCDLNDPWDVASGS